MIGGIEFSPRLRVVLGTARVEAGRLYHEYIGTEHVLLALLRDADGVAGEVLRHLDVPPEQIRHKIEETVPAWRAGPSHPDLPYTSRTKRVFELTAQEASRAQSSTADTEHLLLALCVEAHGVAAHVLAWAGLTTDVARARLVRHDGASAEAPRAPDAE